MDIVASFLFLVNPILHKAMNLPTKDEGGAAQKKRCILSYRSAKFAGLTKTSQEN